MPLSIKVLGPGCANCANLEQNTRAAVNQLGIDAEVEKVTDFTEFARYGLLRTPGLVIEEQLVSGGRVPSVAEISTLIATVAARKT